VTTRSAPGGRVLVFQHHPDEDPAALGTHLLAAGLDLTVIELDAGDAIPDLEPFDLLIAMGGPMDVWQESEHPWLITEKAAIHTWVRVLKRSYLGVCLGHQLLADALGGEVGLMDAGELGVVEITQTPAGAADPVFSLLPPVTPGLQWHHAEVRRLPADGILLARSAACPVQAFRVGPSAWGVQFHVEVEASTVALWAKVPEYAAELVKAGHDDPMWLHDAVEGHLDTMSAASRALMAGLLGTLP
jgi:GMP synthase-like glutamine amidotransferase